MAVWTESLPEPAAQINTVCSKNVSLILLTNKYRRYRISNICLIKFNSILFPTNLITFFCWRDTLLDQSWIWAECDNLGFQISGDLSEKDFWQRSAMKTILRLYFPTIYLSPVSSVSLSPCSLPPPPIRSPMLVLERELQMLTWSRVPIKSDIFLPTVFVGCAAPGG